MDSLIQADISGCTAPEAPSPNKDFVQGVHQGSRQTGGHHGSPADEISPKEWASRSWTAILRSLDRCPAPFDPEEGREAFLARYEERSKVGTAVKWLKFHTSYVFAYAMGQTELPVAPGELEDGERPGRPVGGSIGRALQAIMARGRSGNWACRRCAYDILMSKLGFPPAPAAFVKGALKDHRAALSRRSDVSLRTDENDAILSAVYDKIDEICDSLFQNRTFHHRDAIPSLRACYENGLATGGGLGELFSGFVLPCSVVNVEMLYGMTYEPHLGLREIRFIPGGDVVSAFQDYVDSLWTGRLSEPLKATPCPILEPLKVRTITKGEAAEYYRVLELQKYMHGILRRHPVFEFVGSPISEPAWARAFGTKADLKEGEFFVSGDYKAATDNLNPKLSEYCWEAIASRTWVDWCGHRCLLSATPYYRLGRKALTHHSLFYRNDVRFSELPEGLSTEEEYNALWDSVDQTWGQLMGSPMSFPILCLVNAAATCAALDLKFDRTCQLRINGDDVAFKATPELYEKWKLTTKCCGLEFSLGKNYTSRDFLIMNSELRRAPEGGEDTDWVETGYLTECSTTAGGWDVEVAPVVRPKTWKLEGFINQSILYHTVRKGVEAGHQKDVYWTDLSELSLECVRGFPKKDQWKILQIFLREHKKVIQEMPPLCNLWFPRALGGAGVAVPTLDRELPEGVTAMEFLSLRGRKPELVEKQRKQAAYFACNTEARFKCVSRPGADGGEVGNFFKDLRSLSNGQVPPLLRRTEAKMFTGQRPILVGETLLGYTIRSLCWHFSDLELLHDQSIVGRPEKESLDASHAPRAAYLNNKYKNWTRKALTTSLQPMSFGKLSDYKEEWSGVPYIECLDERVSTRLVDIDHDPSYFYAASDVLDIIP